MPRHNVQDNGYANVLAKRFHDNIVIPISLMAGVNGLGSDLLS